MLGFLNTSTSTRIFADCDVVIEAVTEDEAIKKSVYQSLRSVVHDDAILASNTSTISITRMAQSAPHAERFVGMHFFNPVDRMELVEVIRGEKTERRDRRDDRGTGQEDPQDADRGAGLRGVPGESRVVPVHERVAHASCRKAHRWMRSTARPPVRHADGAAGLDGYGGLANRLFRRQGADQGIPGPDGCPRESCWRCSRRARSIRSRS